MFERKGVILIEKGAAGEDEIMEAGLDAGIEDMLDADDYWEVRTAAEELHAVDIALREAGFELEEADVDFVPNMETEPKDEHALKSLAKMVDAFENEDDVQKVYTNSSVPLHID
jgi:transcriptional/translational regulatory protein YebC/TACO1